MKRRFTLITAAVMLLTMVASTGTVWGQSKDPTIVASFSRSGTTNTVTGGTFSATLSAKTGYYQDGSTVGTSYYMQIKNNSAYWTTTPTSITLTSSIGGGSGNKDLSEDVYAVLLDSNGDVISSSQVTITSHITNAGGDTYNTTIPVTNNVYGIRIHHVKESGYNVRFYSFSLSYEAGGSGSDPSISADDVNIAYNATNGSIAYTLNNATGNVTANITTGGDWLTRLDTITASAVQFTCSANTGAQRTATVTLSFEGADDKVVTVTQAAAPVTHTVTLNLDGGELGETNVFTSNPITLVEGSYTLPSATKTNWFFAGWKDSNTSAIYAAGASYTLNADVTLTAQWVKYLSATYTIASSSSVNATGAPQGSSATFANTYTNNKEQMTNGNSMTLTLSGYAGQRIVGIVLSMHSNGSTGAGYMSAVAGSTNLASVGDSENTVTFNNWPGMTGYTTTYTDVNIPLTNEIYGIQNNETVVITINATANSLFCNSFTIQYQSTSVPAIGINDVTLDYDDESGEITYQLISPDGSTLTPTTTDDWISELAVDAVNSKITFNTTVNNGVKREGTVTLTYGDIVKNVKVTQNAQNFTVAYNANGGTGTMNPSSFTYPYGTTVTVRSNVFTNGSMTFDSWNTAADGTGTTYQPNGTFQINANITLYAQWRTNHSYSLVNSTNDLVPGKHYIIVGKKEDADNYYAMGAQSGSYRSAVSVTLTNGSISETNNVREFVISGNSNNWTLYDKVNPGYLYATSTSSNNIGTRENNNDANSQWSIAFDNDTAFIVAQGSNTRNNLRFNYNNGDPRFSCYASTSSVKTKAYIYVRDNDNDYEFYSPTSLTSVTIAATETYTVESGQILEVTGTLTNNGTAANLIIKDGGQLISGPVQGTMQKEITAYTSGGVVNDNWKLIASPLANAPVTIATAAGNYDLYVYDESTHHWLNQRVPANSITNFTPGRGYLYANETNQTLQFAGELNYSTFAGYPLSFAGEGILQGLNLVSNPRAYQNDMWISASGVAVGDVNYLMMKADGTGFTAGTTDANGKISVLPLRGLFVQATATGQTWVDESVPSSKGIAKSENTENSGILTLNLLGNGSLIDNAIVRLGKGHNLGKVVLNENSTKLYISQGSNEYAIVRSVAQGELPVNFKAAENGSYTLSIETKNVDLNYLHLVDKLTGNDIDLLMTPSYTFEAKTGDNENRFRLVFSGSSTSSETAEPFAYYNGSEWVIENDGEATLQVIDVMGRVIKSEVLSGNASTNTANLSAGVYVLRLVDSQKVKTQKIVVE